MTALTIGDAEIHYQVRRSTRAQVKRIVVTPAGVEVVAPAQADDAEITAFVHSRRGWLFDAVAATRAPPAPFVAPWATGARVRYRGRRVRLVVERGEPSVRFQGRLVVRLPEPSPDAVRDAVDAWMRGRALDAAATLAGEYAARLGVPCPEVRLTDSARCWGECDRSGVVRVHAELIRAPFPLFSYVVAHEVAHLRVRSHSPAFWAALTGLMPEARTLDAELRRWGAGAREL